ncbi:MAG: beta-ketoacyl-[acyl-carrier-protein] synthase family protein, partial [Bacteroidota bacterium]
VVVTGLGVVSALGNSVLSNHDALVKSICGIANADLVQSKYAGSLRFGEVKIENSKLKEQFNVRDAGATRTSLLALHALDEAIRDSRLNPSQISSYETALIGANTVGGMCHTDELYHDAKSETNFSVYMASYDCASVFLFLRERYGIKGITNTINTACSSSANAIMYGTQLIQNGFAKRAIVGGVDSLAKFTINGFNSLGILSPGFCRPFDRERNGLNLGEGAAFLVLEREEDLQGRNPYCYVAGYCNSNDAFHPSSLSDNGEGPYRAMKGALDKASLSQSAIGFVNTHGTGTENNDEVESRAMMRIFEKVPPFASSKSKIGHTLGASAAVEAVFSILALKHGEVFPSLNFINPIESTGLIPVLETQKINLDHVMTNSFGFGGNCTSLIFSKA